MEQNFNKKKEKLTLDSLSVDAIFHIFQWLDAGDLLVLCCVSKHINLLASDDCLWKKFAHKYKFDNAQPVLKKTRSQFYWKDNFCNTRRWAKGSLKPLKLHGYTCKHLMPWLQICAQNRILIASQGSKICSYLSKDLLNEKSLEKSVISELKGHKDDVVRFIKHGSQFFSASMDKTVRVWSVKKRKEKCLAILEGHQAGVYCIDVDRDIILSGSKDQTVKVWSNAHFTCLQTIFVSDHPRCLCINKFKGQFLVGMSAHNTKHAALRLYDLNSGRQICGMTSTGSDIERLGAGILQLKMEDSNSVLSCGYDTTVRLWDLRLRRCVRAWTDPHDNAVFCLESKRDCLVFSGTNRYGVVRLWDKRMSEPVRSFYTSSNKGGSPVYSMQFSKDGLFVGLCNGIQILKFIS